MEKLTRNEVIELMLEKGIDISNKLQIRICDHEGNKLAPERYCYKLYYTLHGKRQRLALWPNTVGYQGF